jgi:hypothetical protein
MCRRIQEFPGKGLGAEHVVGKIKCSYVYPLRVGTGSVTSLVE